MSRYVDHPSFGRCTVIDGWPPKWSQATIAVAVAQGRTLAASVDRYALGLAYISVRPDEVRDESAT